MSGGLLWLSGKLKYGRCDTCTANTLVTQGSRMLVTRPISLIQGLPFSPSEYGLRIIILQRVHNKQLNKLLQTIYIHFYNNRYKIGDINIIYLKYINYI